MEPPSSHVVLVTCVKNLYRHAMTTEYCIPYRHAMTTEYCIPYRHVMTTEYCIPYRHAMTTEYCIPIDLTRQLTMSLQIKQNYQQVQVNPHNAGYSSMYHIYSISTPYSNSNPPNFALNCGI